MKCRVCSAEIPEGKRCCPRCGRVVTAADIKADETKSEPSTLSDRTMVYRPAASKSSQPSDKTINIDAIFSSDPNAPVYSDPHTYDRATADVLEYDRMFMSKRGADDEADDDGDDMKIFDPEQPQARRNFTIEPDYGDDDGYDDDEYDEDGDDDGYEPRGSVIRDRKHAKPRFNFNIKYLLIAIAVIAGLVVIIFGTYQLGKQFGFISTDDEPQSVVSGENAETTTKKKNEPSSDIDNSYTAKTGVYTVYSDQKNIFVYKSVTDQRIIATIPNKTIIEITEIDGEFGKTDYNSYTGWVKLDDLKFTPNETPETTTNEPTSADETTAAYQPGTYTVTLNGTSTTLNVRSTGATDGEIITTLTEGTQVTVEEVKSGWGKIFIDDVEGWVYMEDLK